jgi:hypothetical protein
MSARWAGDHAVTLAGADPAMPAGFVNRVADNWRPLLAVADVVGGEWPERARQAASKLTSDGADASRRLKRAAARAHCSTYCRAWFPGRSRPAVSLRRPCFARSKRRSRRFCSAQINRNVFFDSLRETTKLLQAASFSALAATSPERAEIRDRVAAFGAKYGGYRFRPYPISIEGVVRRGLEIDREHRRDAANLRKFLVQQPALARLTLDALPRFAERTGLTKCHGGKRKSRAVLRKRDSQPDPCANSANPLHGRAGLQQPRCHESGQPLGLGIPDIVTPDHVRDTAHRASSGCRAI